jgi:endo-1,4-beta-xylanase
VTDPDAEPGDGLEFDVAGQSALFGRSGSGTVSGVVKEVPGGYTAVVHLPLATPVAEGGTVQFDLRVSDGSDETGWNTPGSTGTLTLLEPLSYLEVVETPTAPTIDGTVDSQWSTAGAVTTDKQVSGTGGATATVRTLWKGQTLYVLAEVADPVVDVTGSDPWIQDSVELYVDGGNFKNGSYRYDDTQIRISAENAVSFGTGDEAFQAARVQSATALVSGGYRVEAAISLLEYGGLGTFHGLDFQVNDASGGARTGIRNWADPSGVGYQSTARWGVGQLVAAPPPPVDPDLSVAKSTVAAGGKLDVTLEGFAVGSTVKLALQRGNSANSRTTIATVTIGSSGSASVKATVPLTTNPGNYRLVAIGDGAVLDSVDVKVTKATVATVVETIVTAVLSILKRLFG